MTSDKLKEMIEKLKKPKEEVKAEPVAEIDKVEKEIETQEEAKPEEAKKEPVKETKKLTQEEIQQMVQERVIRLRDSGVFRLELLGEIRELTNTVNVLNEILTKLLE